MLKPEVLLYQNLLEQIYVKVSQVLSHISFRTALRFKWVKTESKEGINKSRF